jgi:hypothetical protein
MSPGYAVLAWFRKRWIPAWEHEAVLNSRATSITMYNKLLADYAATATTLAKETAARLAAEEALDEQMKASRFVRGRVATYRTVDGRGRTLRLDVVIDDRVLFEARDTLMVREAIIHQALYKVEHGIRTLDFTLAVDLTKEKSL